MHDLAMDSQGRYIAAFGPGRTWHGLGITLTAATTACDLMKAGHGDYEVEKLLAVCTGKKSDGSIIVAGHSDEDAKTYHIFNKETGQTIANGGVGKIYTVHQNMEWAEAMDRVTSGRPVWDTFAALGDGEKAFLCTLPLNEGEAVKGDTIERRLLATWGHNGQDGAELAKTDIRPVCANTLGAALSAAKHRMKFKHTKNIFMHVEAAVNLMAAADEAFGADLAQLAWLAKQETGEAELHMLCTIIAPRMIKRDDQGKRHLVLSPEASNVHAKLCDLHDGEAKGSQYAPNTRYHILNVATEYDEHWRSVKGSSDDVVRSNIRHIAALTDPARAKKRQALFDALMSPDGLEELAAATEPKIN